MELTQLKAEAYDLIVKQSKLNSEAEQISRQIQLKSNEIIKLETKKKNDK